jgi:hypothetical protein
MCLTLSSASRRVGTAGTCGAVGNLRVVITNDYRATVMEGYDIT